MNYFKHKGIYLDNIPYIDILTLHSSTKLCKDSYIEDWKIKDFITPYIIEIQGNKLTRSTTTGLEFYDIPTFYISKYPITEKMWAEIYPESIKSDYPKVDITIKECLEFIDLLNKRTGKSYRLPTTIEMLFCTLMAIPTFNDTPVSYYSPLKNGLYGARSINYYCLGTPEKVQVVTKNSEIVDIPQRVRPCDVGFRLVEDIEGGIPTYENYKA